MPHIDPDNIITTPLLTPLPNLPVIDDDVDLTIADPDLRIAEIDLARVDAARALYPTFEWLFDEPDHRDILIDPDGMFWTYDDSDPDGDNEGNGWRQHRHEILGVDGKYTTTPSPEDDWSYVRADGPMRLATIADGPPIHKFVYWTEWENGAGVGAPIYLYRPEILP